MWPFSRPNKPSIPQIVRCESESWSEVINPGRVEYTQPDGSKFTMLTGHNVLHQAWKCTFDDGSERRYRESVPPLDLFADGVELIAG